MSHILKTFKIGNKIFSVVNALISCSIKAWYYPMVKKNLDSFLFLLSMEKWFFHNQCKMHTWIFIQELDINEITDKYI